MTTLRLFEVQISYEDQFIEVEAVDEDEAIDKACDLLPRDPEILDIDVWEVTADDEEESE